MRRRCFADEQQGDAKQEGQRRRGTIDTQIDSALDVLRRARILIRTGWCQHADGRNAGGLAVEPWDRSATSWSLLGALVAQTTPLRLERGELGIGALRLALGALAHVLEVDSLTDWNDDPGRTATDVCDILAGAIRRLDQHPGPDLDD